MKHFPHPRFALCAALLVSAAATTSAHASSYHISMTTSDGMAVEGDVETPDRMHLKMPTGESTIIGRTIYMKLDGVWKKADVSELRTANGALMHAYKITNIKKHAIAMVFIDTAGRIAREEIDKTIVHMS